MSEQSSGNTPVKQKPAGPGMNQSAHPGVIVISIVVLFLVLGWWAKINGLLPFLDNMGKERRRQNCTTWRSALAATITSSPRTSANG
jgi:hypothetical protein